MLKNVLLKSSVILIVLSMPMMAESLKGRVFEDTNKNGIYDKETDLKLKDVYVTVTDAQGTMVTAKTNKNGIYKVEGISVGEALIEINETTLPGSNPVQVVGINPSTKNVKAGKTNWSGKDGYTFEKLTGTVCGYVLANRDTIPGYATNDPYTTTANNQVHKGIENVEVNITKNSQVIASGHTNNKGYYCIPNIPLGEVSISINDLGVKDILGIPGTNDPGFGRMFKNDKVTVGFVNKINYANPQIYIAIGF